ncbi:hypothetical protein SVIOM342S_10183 [Streptomyces violaceorubidus]
MWHVEMPGAKVPIRMWTDPATVEEVALQQLRNVATLPWIKGLAVMPDVHYGKGATVGSVIAMQGAVCPAAVGVDIGCGMSAVKTSLTANNLPGDLSRLRSKIEQAIPVGRGMHDSPLDPGRFHGLATAGWDGFWGRFDGVAEAVKFRHERAGKQMGTLGSGNHFIEVCSGRRVPSGSCCTPGRGTSARSSPSTTSAKRRSCRTTRDSWTGTWRCSSRTPHRWPRTGTISGRRSTRSTTARS